MAKETTILKDLGWDDIRSIGEGGQARVYSAQKGGKQWAIKVLACKDQASQSFARFQKEILALQGIDHPGIIRVKEPVADEAKGFYCYVMEWLEGAITLSKCLSGKAVPHRFHRNAATALAVYIQILEALTECEKKGIVHRDLSLGNVLLLPDGKIKLIDFGCCFIKDETVISLTETDEAMGTPHYRAPECAGYSTEQPTSKADLYSAGKILWSLITNQKAFDRESLVFNDLSLTKLLPDAPMTWHLHHIFERTIRHKPTDRYSSVSEALQHANHILGVVRANVEPLENLFKVCPICRIGKMFNRHRLADNTLVDHRTIKPSYNKRDESMIRAIAGTLDQDDSDICTYCGFTARFVKEVKERNLRSRKELS